MDEYAKIFRVCVWFRPPHAPVITEIIATIVVSLVSINSLVWKRIDRGASFCQVRIIIPV